ncbi:uncharacterized protein CANTADRAFT_25357 [Suhomyces tanzawaensis NRRL Y-17324]|uniref:Uncharacterized protein n=1 Tax=Suhomyces tanzawaensis NRRL Y-17324 TaxID=984487 RepID=A0A1E4SNM5_9ASCO|nr:uncharacterized protein CANTADRAFT_25357 [Suhomyces tanzawaensis NRRL Y-17324]ODV81096.1 hypothetical protein CANTADRAFT_25357 [Suhomyces tanzawaensis NRRL Y-17324]
MSVTTARIEDDFDLLTPVHKASVRLDVRDLDQIRSSPYHEKEHWLDLTKVPDTKRVIALALQSFEPRNEQYAFDDYDQAFNIPEIVELARNYAKQLEIEIEPTSVYVIAFRLILKLEVQASSENRRFLAKVDKDSHVEANESGGLLKYWFGTPDDVHGKNLATCWWETKEHAKKGGRGKAHREGMTAVRSWFKHWQVEEYQLNLAKGGESYLFTRVN